MICIAIISVLLASIVGLCWYNLCLVYAHIMVIRVHMVQTALMGAPLERHAQIAQDLHERMAWPPPPPPFYLWWVDHFTEQYEVF